MQATTTRWISKVLLQVKGSGQKDYITYDSIYRIFSKSCFPGGSVIKNLSANSGDIEDEGSTPGQEDLWE